MDLMFPVTLGQSLKLRLRSDVDICTSLSGELDSSSVTSLAKKLLGPKELEFFSSCFDDYRFDEREYITKIKEKYQLKPNYIFASPHSLFETLPKLIWHQEEPFTHLNVYSQWCLIEAIHKKGFKVVLSGHGGDETLAGYYKDFIYYFASLFKNLKWPLLMTELKSYRQVHQLSLFSALYHALRISFSLSFPYPFKDFLRKHLLPSSKTLSYLAPDFSSQYRNYVYPEKKFSDLLDTSSYMAYTIYPIPCWLHFEDRNSKAFSIESRAPFLDHRLVEFAASMSATQKIRQGMTKYVLRNAMKGLLPEEVRQRIDKKGFSTPSEIWFKEDLKKQIEEILTSGKLAKRGYLNQRRILRAFNNHCQGKENLRFAIWSWVNLELWLDEFFN